MLDSLPSRRPRQFGWNWNLLEWSLPLPLWAGLAALLAGFGWVGSAQTARNVDEIPVSSEFAIETWRTDNGIPQNTITSVFQTRRGYIWAGTYNGLVEFDGLRFKVFDSANTKGLANSRVTSLHEDAAGTIWMGHDTGEVTKHSDEGFAAVPLATGWGRTPIKDFAEDEQGSLWAFNQLGEAMRLRDGRMVRPPTVMGEYPFVNPRVTMDALRGAFVIRNGVVARFSSQGYAVQNFSDPSDRPYYSGMAQARDGNLWILGEGRLRKWDGTNWVADVGEFSWAGISVTTVLETTSGQLLVGTLQNGLLIFEPSGGWTRLNRNSGLPQDWVCSIAEDSEKNIWVGTGGGLALLRERKVAMLSPPDDWEGRPVLSITRAQDGAVWAATEGAGIYRFKAGAWTHFAVPNPFVWSLLADSKNQIWAGTWGGGLLRLAGDQFVSQTNLVSPSDPVPALLESAAGTLWLGTGTGLGRIENGAVERFTAEGGVATGDTRILAAGAHGEIWVGTQGAGLGCWKDGRLQSFRDPSGLPGDFIMSLHAEANGTLWIGTLDHGLCRYKDGQFRAVTTSNGLPSSLIYHIEDDQEGRLWFNSTIGIYRIRKQQLNACADGTSTNLDVLAYGKAEGLATIAGTGGFSPSGFRAPDGGLWFSTARGIAVVAPRLARPNPVRPPVWIEEVFVDGKSVPFRRTGGNSTPKPRKSEAPNVVVLPPGRRQLEVQFTGMSYTAPERVQFRYRLEGMDRDWLPSSTRRRVTFSFLPPGDYAFHVTACNSDGLWNVTGDTLDILVQPHFWQTWWFTVTMLSGGAVALALVFFLESRRRLRVKLERITQERALERERSRIAQDIHDDLGASLTRIGLLSESAAGDLQAPNPAAARLVQIISTTRDLTRSMDEIVWAVNPRHDTLESVTNYISRFAQDFLSAAGIRFRLAMPLQVPEIPVRSEVRHNLFLACKEALHNVVKHAHATEVRLSMEFVTGGLRFVIADNGPGFDPLQQARAAKPNRHASGNGLPNLEIRLKQIGGHSQIKSSPGEGTEVEFFVPLGPNATALDSGAPG